MARVTKEYELIRGKGVLPGGPSFRSFAHGYLNWHANEYPDSHYRIRQIVEQWLIPEFGLLPVGMVPRHRVEEYKHKRKAAPSTIAKELRTLQAIINKAVEWGEIGKNPIHGIRPPQDLGDNPPPFYELDQIHKIYEHSYDDLAKARWQLMFNTGMRRSEGLQLKREWISDDNIKILSYETSRTKSGKWRLVPQNAATRDALATLLQGDGSHVLPQVHPKSFSRAFENTLRRADLPGSLHWTRHTYASHLVMAGVPLRTVQILLGHSTIRTTEQYAHLAPDYLRSVTRHFAL